MACAWEPRVSKNARQRRTRVALFIIATFILQQTCQQMQLLLCNTRKPEDFFPLLSSLSSLFRNRETRVSDQGLFLSLFPFPALSLPLPFSLPPSSRDLPARTLGVSPKPTLFRSTSRTADMVLAHWDASSPGQKFMMTRARDVRYQGLGPRRRRFGYPHPAGNRVPPNSGIFAHPFA